MSDQDMNDQDLDDQQDTSDQQPSDYAPDMPFPPAVYPGLAIVAGYFLQGLVPLPQPTHTSFIILGSGFFIIGILLIGWSLSTLRKFKTTAIPHQAATSLVTTGPYRISRNPVYLAFLLLMLASALTTGNLWILLFLPVVMGLLNIYAIGPEEKHLQLKFGDSFENYLGRVRPWL